MDYTDLVKQTLAKVGRDCVVVPNAFGHHDGQQWQLHLPALPNDPDCILVLNFQDWMSWNAGYLELHAVQQFYGHQVSQILVTTLHHEPKRYYSGPVPIVEFSSHNIREIQLLQGLNTEWTLTNKTVAWQCLNGRETPHRVRAANVLKTWPNGWLSLGNTIALHTWPYSSYRGGTENNKNFQRLQSVYGTAAVNIVTETQYDYPCLISEKTLYAFAACQVPVIVGHRDIVAHCEAMGFDMFRDIVDTSYDNLDNDCRVEQAILRNKDLIQGQFNLEPLRSRLMANRQRVISGSLIDYYCANLAGFFES